MSGLRYAEMTEQGIVERDKVRTSIERLRSFEPEEGYWLAFSGGKDSVVLKALADMAGVKYDAHYSVTTVDPPELIYFMREHHPDVIFEHPDRTMWQLIIDNKIPPTRRMRYCCAVLKESGGQGRVTLTGVRWAESINRKKNKHLVNIGSKRSAIVYNDDNDESRRQVEQCYRTKKTMVNPIIDWIDDDVWQFIHENNIPYCKLYDEGYKRLGCIGCPMVGGKRQTEELERYPKFRAAYVRAFDRMLAKRIADGKLNTFKDGEDVMQWWTGVKPKDEAFEEQIDMWEEDDEADYI